MKRWLEDYSIPIIGCVLVVWLVALTSLTSHPQPTLAIPASHATTGRHVAIYLGWYKAAFNVRLRGLTCDHDGLRKDWFFLATRYRYLLDCGAENETPQWYMQALAAEEHRIESLEPPLTPEQTELLSQAQVDLDAEIEREEAGKVKAGK